MQFDIAAQIGAVTRSVETRTHEGKPANVVVATRTYETDPKDLWDALTSKERIPRWFLPISGDLRLGGRYQLQGNAGGTITQCEPPRHVALTWEFGGQISWVVVRLTPTDDGRTHLQLEHILPPDEKWDEYGPGAVGVGWDLGLFLGLARHIETGASNDPEAGLAWMLSDEGKRFVRSSSDDWCRAYTASGTDADKAKAAASRTTAAYTGDAPDSDSKPA